MFSFRDVLILRLRFRSFSRSSGQYRRDRKKAYDTKEEKPVSKVTLNNKNYFVVFEGPTKHLESPRLEVHHKAIDIHVVFEGEEAIWYGDCMTSSIWAGMGTGMLTAWAALRALVRSLM